MKYILTFLLLGLISCFPQKESTYSTIICDGNSLTFGSSLNNPSQESFPALLSKMGWKVKNFGVPGQTSEQMLEDVTEQIDPLFEPQSLVIFWEGVNSFTRSKLSAEKAYASLDSYVRGRKEKGFKTAVMTMLPDGKIVHAGLGVEKFQEEYNELVLRNSAGADIVIDLTKDLRLQNTLDGNFFSGDRIHLTAAGQGVVAENVSNALLKKF